MNSEVWLLSIVLAGVMVMVPALIGIYMLAQRSGVGRSKPLRLEWVDDCLVLTGPLDLSHRECQLLADVWDIAYKQGRSAGIASCAKRRDVATSPEQPVAVEPSKP